MRILGYLIALLLAGCSGVVRESQTTVYDFGVRASMTKIRNVSLSGTTLEVNAPGWLDNEYVAYRLLYDDPLKIRYYADSRWVGVPAALIEQRLRDFTVTTPSPVGSVTPCRVRIELTEFSQVFDSPQRSRALLQGRARLVDAKLQSVAVFPLDISVAAEMPNAQGGVKALASASNELARQIFEWLQGSEQGNNRPVCGRGK